MDLATLFLALLALLWGGFGALVYVLMGLPRLWGPSRGEPFCGHPFELTWGMNPQPKRWRCPKCLTLFERREHADGVRRWTMVR